MKAVIDIGTNTFHLNIADVLPDGEIKFYHKSYEPVKLGEGGINKGTIAPEAYKRGVDTLISFSKIIAEYPVQQVFALATAAVRDANNGEHFIKEVFEKSGLQIKIISGIEEAQLIYEGAKSALKLCDNTFLIMDIGGGSVEFIICDQTQIYWKESFKVGAARLMEKFMKNDPLLPLDIETIESYLEVELYSLLIACKEFKPQILVGTAGSFETYAEIANLKNGLNFNPDQEKSFVFNTTELHTLLNTFKTSTRKQRAETKGLIPLRLDMIVMASIITSYILNKTKISKISLSTFALKEGALLSL
jgi:exopolyphosphatase/guanosine-5'-triphosphate,3'-diphosphate pyrophosphatase